VMAPAADAQITYMDVDPDETVQGNTFDLDIDGDGAADVQFFQTIGTVAVAGDRPIAGVDNLGTGTAFVGYAGPYFNYPSALDVGAEIGPAANFPADDFTVLGSTYGPYGPYGPWAAGGQTDKYLGVQFMAGGGTTHYAWVRLDVAPNSASITVKDFAFEATPDTPIDAGAMGVAIEPGPDGLPGTHNLSAAFPNPFNAGARFTLEVAEQQDVRVEVFNALGQRVATLHDGALTAGTIHEFDIDGSDLASGVYLIRTAGERFSDMQQVTLTR
ncbi:MAG: T9SS type A sorting domain-containing protein, partial [Rhodothermaceae bacterium]|nr:T9SS type A sorting domain-containing protein [Rhodothermaceae bacterium]